MARHRQHSLGEMISSLTFFGCAIYLVVSAADWQDQGIIPARYCHAWPR